MGRPDGGKGAAGKGAVGGKGAGGKPEDHGDASHEELQCKSTVAALVRVRVRVRVSRNP